MPNIPLPTSFRFSFFLIPSTSHHMNNLGRLKSSGVNLQYLLYLDAKSPSTVHGAVGAEVFKGLIGFGWVRV